MLLFTLTKLTVVVPEVILIAGYTGGLISVWR